MSDDPQADLEEILAFFDGELDRRIEDGYWRESDFSVHPPSG